jgi:hypothetical protein
MRHSKNIHLGDFERIVLFWLAACCILAINHYIIISLEKKRFIGLREFIILASTSAVNPVIMYSLAPIFSTMSIISMVLKVLETLHKYLKERFFNNKL